VPFAQEVTGLLPNAEYYFCAAAANAGGATFGEVHSFTTSPVPPRITTVGGSVTASGAVTLAGLADAQGTATTTWFRFDTVDPVTCSDAFGTRWPEANGTAVGAGRTPVSFTEVVADLPPGRYHACAIGSNAAGVAYGELVTFVIPEPESPAAGGCGCRAGAGGEGASLLAFAALLLVGVRRRRWAGGR
jgi:MYXO-CTERM domain-containing protein